MFGTIEQRLAMTYYVAKTNSSLGHPYSPWLMWNSFYRGVQEDSQELLQRLLDPELAPALNVIARGTNHPNLICPHCSSPRPVTGVENFTMLQLEIAGESSLQSAVDQFVSQRQQLDGSFRSTCSVCGVEDVPFKQNSIKVYPQVLFVHFMRFQTHYQGPDRSSQQEYLRHHVLCEDTIRFGEVTYRLSARVYHQGPSTEVGHYFTICRHVRPSATWWYMVRVQ